MTVLSAQHGNLLLQELLLAVSVQLTNTVELELIVRTVGLASIENRTHKESANNVPMGPLEHKAVRMGARYAQIILEQMTTRAAAETVNCGNTL